MSKEYYLPMADEQRAAWLNNFAVKLPLLDTRYNISASEQADVIHCAAYFDALIRLKNQFGAFQSALIGYKNGIRNGLSQDPTITIFPVVPIISLPTAPAFDIFGRIALIVSKIKTNYQYTETDGKSLGIIDNATQSIIEGNAKPVILGVFTSGGRPEVIWRKNEIATIETQVNRGKGWEFLSTNFVPDYIDTHPLPAAGQTAIWSYRAIYKLGEEQVGQWSDIAEFAVTRRGFRFLTSINN